MPQTYEPMFDLSAEFPSINHQDGSSVALALCYATTPNRCSKFGGHFLWPHNEPWPRCADHDNSGIVPVLQINKKDVSELLFPNGSDLLNIFWCPDTDHYIGDECWGPKMYFVRRNTSDRSPIFLNPEEILLECCFELQPV